MTAGFQSRRRKCVAIAMVTAGVLAAGLWYTFLLRPHRVVDGGVHHVAEEPDEEILANFRAVSRGGWRLQSWMSGASYAPYEPIDITLRLVPPNPDTDPSGRVEVKLTLEQIDGAEIRQAKPEATFRRVERNTPAMQALPGVGDRAVFVPVARDVPAWDLPVKDAFGSGRPRPPGTTLPLGRYLLFVEVLFLQGSRFSEPDMRIELGIPVEVAIYER